MGQTAQTARARGIQGGLLVLGLTAAIALISGCAASTRNAATVLLDPVAVTVLDAAGTASVGIAGERVLPGEQVRLGPTGSGVLVTAGRRVWLGSGTALAVVNGAEQELEHGWIMVDGEHGPGVVVHTGPLAVASPAGAAVRIERGFSTRVGVLVGSVALTSRVGRSITLGSLHQVQATGAALPDGSAPLRLTDDAAERAVAPDLVADDELLRQQAATLDSGQPATGVLRAVFVDYRQRAVAGAPSETVLPLVISETATVGPDTLSGRTALVRALRAAGGSWGVLAHLSGTTAVRTGGALDALLSGLPGGTAATGTGTGSGNGPGARRGTGRGAGPITLAGGADRGTATVPTAGAGSGTGAGGGPGSSQPPGAPTSGAPVPTTGSPITDPGLISTLVNTLGGLVAPSPVPSPTGGPGGLLP